MSCRKHRLVWHCKILIEVELEWKGKYELAKLKLWEVFPPIIEHFSWWRNNEVQKAINVKNRVQRAQRRTWCIQARKFSTNDGDKNIHAKPMKQNWNIADRECVTSKDEGILQHSKTGRRHLKHSKTRKKSQQVKFYLNQFYFLNRAVLKRFVST